jgi:hypothetical protein
MTKKRPPNQWQPAPERQLPGWLRVMCWDSCVLALRMKPIIEAKAKANQAAMGGALREKSHEVDAPIRTDEVVAGLANLGKDTIRKIEHIEQAVFLERINQAGGVGFMACDCRNVMRELQSMKGTI